MAHVTVPSRRRSRESLIPCSALLFLAASCAPPAPPSVPAELVGTWATEARKYADRKLEIWDDAVIFYTGARWKEFTVHRIQSVQTVEGASEGTLFSLYYAGLDDTVDRFSFYFDGSTGVLRFENQRSIEWRKVGPPSRVD